MHDAGDDEQRQDQTQHDRGEVMDHRQYRRTQHCHGDVPQARLLRGAAGGDGCRQAPQEQRQREALVGDRGVEVQPGGIERVDDRTDRRPAGRSADRPDELVDGQDGQDVCQDDRRQRRRATAAVPSAGRMR